MGDIIQFSELQNNILNVTFTDINDYIKPSDSSWFIYCYIKLYKI